MSEQKIYLSWEEFERDIKLLADKIDAGKISKIVAVTKGGLIPAYYLAKYLNVKYLETLCISSYDAKDNPQEPVVIPFSKEIDTRKGWLIVDDLADRGKTMELARAYFPNASFACLYKKPHTLKDPDFFVSEKDSWVVFPWE